MVPKWSFQPMLAGHLSMDILMAATSIFQNVGNCTVLGFKSPQSAKWLGPL